MPETDCEVISQPFENKTWANSAMVVATGPAAMQTIASNQVIGTPNDAGGPCSFRLIPRTCYRLYTSIRVMMAQPVAVVRGLAKPPLHKAVPLITVARLPDYSSSI
jgi:hypothetical protein